MSLTVAIEIPQEVLHAARMTPEEVKRELAVLLFQQGKLSFGKAREMAGMTVWTFQQLLGSRGIRSIMRWQTMKKIWPPSKRSDAYEDCAQRLAR